MTGGSWLGARRLAVVVSVGAVAALGLSACGSSGSGSSGGNGKTLSVDTSFVLKGLDPGTVYEGTGNMIVHSLYDTLVTFTGSDISKPQPDLASSYTAAPDGKSFTFTLRSDAKFADGSPVTSADVVWSLNRLKNLKGSAAAIVSDLSFSAPDAHTVVVTSSDVNPNVPTLLAAPYAGVLNQKLAEQHGGKDGTDAAKTDTLGSYLNTHALGSGPYQIASFDSASQVVLTANPKYWGHKPAFGRVVVSNMDVQTQKLTMAKSPSDTVALDLAGNALSGLPSSLHQTGSPDTYYQLRLDADPAISKVTSNRDWVQALRASLDYQGIAALFGKSGSPAAGMVPTAYAGALPAADAQQQDLAKAKSLLAASGVGGQTVKMLYPAITYVGVDLGTIAAKVQSDAAKAGIKIQLDPAPIASFLDQRNTNKVPFSFSPQSLDYPAAASIVADTLPGGHTATAAGWTAERADPATVAAGKAVLAATSAADQVAALQKWQQLMIENGPYITMCYSSGTVVSSSNLSDAVYTAAGWTLDLAGVSAS
jgi:peptide/nickel transport system substrate-binding protein